MPSIQWDEKHLQTCLHLAKQAEALGEVPVGALVADTQTGKVIAKSLNLRESLQSPIGHAEIVAIHRACRKLKTWRLKGYTLYSS